MREITEIQALEKHGRMYHVIVKVIKTGRIVCMTAHPVTHAQGCTILAKMTKYPWRQETLVEVTV